MNSRHSGRVSVSQPGSGLTSKVLVRNPQFVWSVRRSVSLLFLLTLLFAAAVRPATAQAAPAPQPPATVLLLSPAEGPIAVAPNFGVKPGPPLTSEGYARAKDLPQLFTGTTPRLPRPDALFASHLRVPTEPRSKKNKKAAPEPETPQAVDTTQTLESVAKTFNLAVEETYADDDYPYLANVLLSGEFAGKVILVVWHTGTLDKLAAALGVAPPPAPWPATQSDRIWRLDWTPGTAKPTLSDLPQQLLPGDSK
jgi:hypothetical protein